MKIGVENKRGIIPRSRGVYSLIITALRDAGGSSPLARGLRVFP